MNWLKNLFQHNKAWIAAVGGSMAVGAATSLQTTGKVTAPYVIGAGLLGLAGALTKSPLPQTPEGAARGVVAAIAGQAASDIAAGSPVGTQVIVDAGKQVVEAAVEQTPPA